MDLIYANSERKDLGIVRAYNFDLAFGSDENNFELKIDTDNHCCEAGYYVYIEGTEYGGIIDAVASDTAAEEVTYTGRTWHGILNSKVLCPDSGQDYLTLNGNANTVLSTLISRMGLTSIFEASSDASALTISSYKMERYITGYDGIRKMLKTVNGKLVMSYNGTKVVLSAVPIVDYTDAGVIDSDIMSFSVKKTSRKVNHLICLGQGELKDRAVIHLYADASGNISQTQTLTGLDEYTAVYDNPNAESIEKLREAGTEQLAELQKQDDLSVSLSEGEDVFDVGDIVGAVDNVTGIAISVPISKKIISIQNDYLSAAYETEIGKVRTSNSGQINGSGGTAATISIGTVTTGAAGSDAQVTNSGTPTAAVLNFVIPRGDAGTADGAVRYDIQQTLSDTEKAKARANIGVGNGENGATFTPSVSADGTLSWTNNKGLTNPEPVNIKGEDGAFRINVTYSGGVYSADKTFDEIKAAYDAGQQPYVVYGGDTMYTLSYCYFASEQMFMDFERYLIWEDSLKTETLRIYSFTTGSGSNIEQRISAFNVPNGTTYVKVSSTGGVITTVHGETYSDIKTLINAGKPVVVRYNDVLDFYYFETFGFSDSSGTHTRLNFRCDMGSSVYTLALRDDNTWAFSETSLQSTIDDVIMPLITAQGVRDFHVTGTASQDGYITAVTFKDGYPKSDLDNLITQGAKIRLVVDHDAMSDYFNLSYSVENGYCGFSGMLLVTQDNTAVGQVIVYNGTDFTVYGNNAT